MTDTEARRIHERIDELATHVGEIAGDVKVIAASCKDCKQRTGRINGAIASAVAATIAAVVAGLVIANFVA